MFVGLKGVKQKDVLKHQKRLKKKKKGGFDRKEGILKCNGMYVCTGIIWNDYISESGQEVENPCIP